MVLDKIRSLFKGKKPEEPGKGTEKPSSQSAAEFALDDLKSGLLDGRYGLLVWDKVCDDPGMKPDLLNVVAAMDGESLTYRGTTRKGGVASVQITTSRAPGTATVYIITRSFLNELLERIEDSLKKRLKIEPKEVAIIHVASPETLKLYYNIEFNTCVPLPIHRKFAEEAINTAISEIEKRIKGFFEAVKQPDSQAQMVT
jgi:hypothetical protein